MRKGSFRPSCSRTLSRNAWLGGGCRCRYFWSGSKLAEQRAKTSKELASNTKTDPMIRRIVKKNISAPYVGSERPPPIGSHVRRYLRRACTRPENFAHAQGDRAVCSAVPRRTRRPAGGRGQTAAPGTRSSGGRDRAGCRTGPAGGGRARR